VVRRFRDRGDEVIAVGRDPEKIKALDARSAIVGGAPARSATCPRPRGSTS
jgi:hypothetical protein